MTGATTLVQDHARRGLVILLTMQKTRIKILAVIALLAPGIAVSQPVASLAPATRLNTLATRLNDAPAPLRADLARIALAELADVYNEEAERARHDHRHPASSRDLGGWTAGVQRLASDYESLAESIRPDTPIEMSIGPDNSLNLVVDGHLAVVSSPRMNQQIAFEQRIIQQFCALNTCADLVTDPAPVETLSARDISAKTQWQFSDRSGPSCASDDGLEFQFRNLGNMENKRAACADATTELHRLAAAIALQLELGVQVDWDALAIYQRPDPDEQKVVVNFNGSTLTLPVPLLAQRPELLRTVRPWLAANVRGEHFNLVLINAGDLLGEPGQPLE